MPKHGPTDAASTLILSYAETSGTSNGIRLIASDLDGTLLRSDDSVSERTLAALERTVDAGIRFVLVSARSPGWLAPEAARLGLDGIGICCNGAIVYDYEAERVLIHRPLEPETARELVHGAAPEAAPGVVFGCERPRASWPSPPTCLSSARPTRSPAPTRSPSSTSR